MTWKNLKHESPPTGMEVILMDSRTGSIRMMPYEWGIGAIGENWSHWIQYTPPAPEPEKEEWEVAWDKITKIAPALGEMVNMQAGFKRGFLAAKGGGKQ